MIVRLLPLLFLPVFAGCGDDDEERSRGRIETRSEDEAVRAAGERGDGPTREPVGEWRAISEEGAPVGRDGFAAGAFGRRIFVWGGHTVEGQFQTYLNGGAILDTASGEWTELGTEGAPSARVRHVAVFADALLFVWGGRDGMNPLGDGGIYDPDTRAWRATGAAHAPPPTSDGSAVYTGREILLFGGLGSESAYHGGGAIYDPRSNAFRPMSTVGAPSPRAGHTAVWTGEEMVVWGGIGPAGPLGDGARYDPEDDTWRPISREGAPSPRLRHVAAWTGEQMVVWGGEGRGNEPLGDGAAYVAAEDLWRTLPTAGAPSARTGASGAFLGDRVVVFGGETAEGLTNDGAVFDPVTDTWVPLATEGAPSPRRDHRARTTDDGMVVWGGTVGEGEYTTSGGIFTL